MSRNLRLSSEIELAAIMQRMRSPRSEMREAESSHRVNDVPKQPESRLLTLAWPPTGNHTVKHTSTGGHYLTAEAGAYRRHVATVCAGVQPIFGPYRLLVRFSPPDARRRDMDNALKSMLDALVKARFLCDDSMTYLRELRVDVDDSRRGNVIVIAEPLTP